ncbi:MAG: formylglycine-generating enzyme family protein [Anaerolineae bacterium]|nr:formylglycine-generating enzyme family protein [Anaerolineae bacterium]
MIDTQVEPQGGLSIQGDLVNTGNMVQGNQVIHGDLVLGDKIVFNSLTLLVVSDGALGPERERLLELLSSLPLSRPPVGDGAPSSEPQPGEAQVPTCGRVFIMLLGSDINGFLETEQRRAREAGIEDRLYLLNLPPGQEIDRALAEYLGGRQISFHGPDDLVEKARPGLIEMILDRLDRVDLEALLKWAILYGLGAGVLVLLHQAIAAKAPAVSSGPTVAGEGAGTSTVSPERPVTGRESETSAVSPESPVTGRESETPSRPATVTVPAQPLEPPGVPVPQPPLRTTAGGLTVATPQNIRQILALPDPPERLWWEKAGLELCLVPAGAFLMGTREDEISALIAEFGNDPSWYEREIPQHPVSLPAFYIGRYPVTQAQYARFVQAAGHDVPYREWDGAKPYNWDRASRTPPPGKEGHPVNLIHWHDALAYCRWAGLALPSEAEWEKAASWEPIAGRKRRYPWGGQWDASRCNSSEGKKGGTTPVGLYSPRGDSHYGCADMAGNVWEWTRSRWGADWSKPDFGYPYDPADGREDLAAGGYRGVRGGAWYDSHWDARCAFRCRDFVDAWGSGIGFRVCASVSLAGSVS